MLHLVRVTAFDPCQRCLGERGLQEHDFSCALLGGRGRIAQELEHFLHVRLVFIPVVLGLCIRLHVVVAIRQTEAALIETCNFGLRIIRVLVRARFEQDAAAGRLTLKPDDQARERTDGCRRRNRIEIGFERGRAKTIDPRLVHTRCVIVADLLRHRIPVHRCGGLLQDPSKHCQIVLGELAVHAP